MKIYLDLVFIINFFFDFVLLFGTKYILKKRIKLIRIFLGSIIGGLSIFFLFIPINSISLFIFKIIISIIMIIVTFGEKDFFKTYLYFYILSIFLGGTMYLLNNMFSYKNEGIIFFSNGLSINFIIMLILSPIIIYLYVKEKKEHDNTYNNIYKVEIYLDGNKYILNGYLDTGNNLFDPYKKRPIIIINNKIIKFDLKKYILVPYKTISESGIIKCLKPERIVINNIEYKNYLIGESKEKIYLNNSDCILPNKLKEEL